jgi:hypothetical protein
MPACIAVVNRIRIVQIGEPKTPKGEAQIIAQADV